MRRSLELEKQFASKYEREEHGWIVFPRDIEYRRKLFPNPKLEGSVRNVFDHPAKMNLFLVESLVEYISEPGDWILDPFGGTGSSAMAARMGRHVVLIDVEEEFGETIKESASILVPGGFAFTPPNGVWTWLPPSSQYGEIRLYIGDNRKVTREIASGSHGAIRAVITSPPYSTALNPGSNPLEVKGKEGTLANYSRNFNNMSQLNPFYWEQAMKTLWEGMWQVLEPGAKVAMVNKDISKGGGRELLSAGLTRQAQAVGFKYLEWHKWKPPGTIRQETARNKGGTVIEDEDIIIYGK